MQNYPGERGRREKRREGGRRGGREERGKEDNHSFQLSRSILPHLVHFESYPCSWNDDLLDTVHILEHPLISRMIRSSVTQEHTIQTVHKVITGGGKLKVKLKLRYIDHCN